MKLKILKVYELNGLLNVETECEYGKDKFGLSLDKKYKNPLTDEPKYIDEVKWHIKKKYSKELVKEKAVDKSKWGKTIEV